MQLSLRLSLPSTPTNVIFLPRYVNKDREITKHLVQHAEERGVKALFITVDAPQLGRREKVRSVVFIYFIDIRDVISCRICA